MSASTRIATGFLPETEHSLVLEFFLFFSRFEYALKEAGFLKEQQRAEPDWNKFSQAISGQFETVACTDFNAALQDLKNDPPKQQVVNNAGQLGWTVPQTNGTEKSFLHLVKTVRNNLFHGGKSPYDPDRDSRLVSASLVVLQTCIGLNDDVKGAFYS